MSLRASTASSFAMVSHSSQSWRCTSVRRAVIASFSPRLNAAMTAYVTAARDHIAAGENLKAAQLLNDTVGQHLPRIMKLYNYRYLSTLPRDEQDQVAFHVDQILAIRPEDYLHEFRNIECGLKFLNGEIDDYTTPEDARSLSAHLKRAEFLTIEQAGHFPQEEQPKLFAEKVFAFAGKAKERVA